MDLRRVPERWRRLDVTLRDLPLGLALAGLSFLPVLRGHETQVGDLPGRELDALGYAFLALLCLPLALRRKSPAVSLALVSAAFIGAELGSYHTVAGTAIAIAVLSAGAHLDHHRRTAIGLLTAAYTGLAFALTALGSTEGVEGFATFYAMFTATWIIGAWQRAARAAEAEARRRIAATTVAAERARIARELHDVVTHHVTAMVVQAEAARYLTGAPDRLDRALAAVGDTGRRATADLRHLLDLLSPDHDHDPSRTPAAGRLLTLVEQSRGAGQPVAFTEEGEPAEAAGSADLVAYRVVQEALTNALKYARGAPTDVRVRHRDEDITVEVATGATGTRSAVGGSGRGLAGLRERVGVLGGDFDAGDRDGRFVVRARIPAGSRA